MQPHENASASSKNKTGSKAVQPSPRHKARIRKIFQKSSNDKEFAELVNEALGDTNCSFLFEIPGVLFEKPLARAAVIRSDGKEENDCFFIVHDVQKKSTRILASDKVDGNILKLTHSYANLLACLHQSNLSSSVH